MRNPRQPRRRIPALIIIPVGFLGLVLLCVCCALSWFATSRMLLSLTGTIGMAVDSSPGSSTPTIDAKAWSPDSRYIAAGTSNNTVQVWDARTGRSVMIYRGHAAAVQAVSWSPDGKRIASSGAEGTVQVWDVATGRTLLTHRNPSSLPGSSLVWSPDGRRIASNVHEIWDAATGRTMLTFESQAFLNALAWSPDGKYIVAANNENTVQVWSASTGHVILTYRGHSRAVQSVGWSPDGRRIASAGDDGTVQVWDALTGKHVLIYRGQFRLLTPRHNRPHPTTVTSVSWSPDSKYIATVSDTTRVWNAATGEDVFEYGGNVINSGDRTILALWSPNGKYIASAFSNGAILAWQAPPNRSLLPF